MDLPGLLSHLISKTVTKIRVVRLILPLAGLLVSCRPGLPGNGRPPDAATVAAATLAAVTDLRHDTAITATPSTGAAPSAPPEPATAALTTTLKAAAPAMPTLTPTATPVPIVVNGITLSTFVIMPPEVIAHSQEIFTAGQAIGRNPRAFSKLGDSTILNPQLLGLFDEPNGYVLGHYAFLQPTIEYFAGSFGRYGVASEHGLHAWSVFDPLWADKDWCQPGEHMLACEFRLYNPAALLVRLGSNDNGSPAGFAQNVRQVVEYCLENGVIPVIGTKADRFEGPENTNNIILRDIAAQYRVPLWDFDLVAETLPARGLDSDNVHMVTTLKHAYTLPETFEIGHAVQDLTGLLLLDALRREVIEAAPAATPAPPPTGAP